MKEQRFNFKKRRDCRIFALEQLTAFLILNESKDTFIKNLFENSEFNFVNTFAQELLENTIDQKEQLIAKINTHLKEGWTFDRLQSQDQALLLMASYELLNTDTNKAIVINETIEIAKLYSYSQSIIFINAVIDKIS